MAFIQSSSLLYVVIDRPQNDDAVVSDTVNEDIRLMEVVKNSLSADHELIPTATHGHFFMSLCAVTRDDAMQAARLVRNAFQRRNLPSKSESICIGLILHNHKVSLSNEYMDIAQELAIKACKIPGNNIEFLDLNEL